MLAYHFGNNLVSNFINSERIFINSASFRRCHLSIRYQFGEIIYQFGINSAEQLSFRYDFLSFRGIFRDYRLIVIFPGNENDFFGIILHFSGLIVPKLSRVCRIFPKLLIAILSFRLSIRVFCR